MQRPAPGWAARARPHDLVGDAQEAVIAQVHHAGPRGRDERARPAAGEPWHRVCRGQLSQHQAPPCTTARTNEPSLVCGPVCPGKPVRERAGTAGAGLAGLRGAVRVHSLRMRPGMRRGRQRGAARTRRYVEPAAPLGHARVLVPAQGRAAVQHHARALQVSRRPGRFLDSGHDCTCTSMPMATHARPFLPHRVTREEPAVRVERSATAHAQAGERALCAMPNLCVSTLMLLTPGTAKSNAGTGQPSCRANGSTKPPRHASTWHQTPARRATCGGEGS
jgi:hypothetical protein